MADSLAAIAVPLDSLIAEGSFGGSLSF